MKALLYTILVCLAIVYTAHCQTSLLKEMDTLEQTGEFKKAAVALTNALADPSLPQIQRKTLEFEMDRLERIKRDFPFTKAELFSELQKAVKDLTSAEYDRWVEEGRFDSRVIDGERKFMGSSVSNLYFRYPELNTRRIPPRDTADFEKARWENCVSIRQAAAQRNTPYVLPKRFQVTMTVTAKPDAAPDGQKIRAWLPIPRAYPFQKDFALLTTSPAPLHIEGEQSPIRSICLEADAKENQPTTFKVEYLYTSYGVRFEVDPVKVKPCDAAEPDLRKYLTESPHVVFTPEIRQLSKQIAGEEPNPFIKAKKFYDWISDQIKYSYAIEYSTIRNISDYCRTKRYGDCGQEALLFMTLCRLNGVPARWQSGWNTVPGGKTIHDWCEIYIAPYGWMPVDPYMGIYAMRYAQTLSPAQKREIRDFYFGGLDQYRMAANSDHNQELTPPKRSMRSDDVDFQRGELEWADHNIYFNNYSWELSWKELKPALD